VLGNGGKYKLWFPNYTVQSGRPVRANNKATTERFSISTQSLDYVLGTFRLPGYETITTIKHNIQFSRLIRRRTNTSNSRRTN
jgi:hypothetical protein